MLVLFETLNRVTIEALKLRAHSEVYVESCLKLDTMRIKVDLFVQTFIIPLHLLFRLRRYVTPNLSALWSNDGGNVSHRDMALIQLMVFSTFWSCRYFVCRLGEDEISWLIWAWQKILSPLTRWPVF